MSIEINTSNCTGCGQCAEVCPGSLIRLRCGKAEIPHPERCWGCASCMKECPAEAIALFLGKDMGGLGGRLTARRENTAFCWTVTLPDGSSRNLVTDSRDSNKY